MVSTVKPTLKQLLGDLPLTAEVYWSLRQAGKPIGGGYSLHRLEDRLPLWCEEVHATRKVVESGRRILVFATLRYWIEHATLLCLGLAGLGHRVWLSYLPYANWKKPVERFDLRRQDAYTHGVLSCMEPLVEVVPLLRARKPPSLPVELESAIQESARRDAQYTLQVEEVDPDSPLYRLRLQRDCEAARAALASFYFYQPEVLIVPNGSIMEFGALYRVARYYDRCISPLMVITYEFGEQRGRIWLAQNDEVMLQDTSALWAARESLPLAEAELDQVKALFAARQRGSLWENFARRWQGVPSEGSARLRSALSLDDPGKPGARPVVLLATNVIGDSLTLGRQVFSDSMSEWLERTVRFFARRPDVQLVVRIHPGELITKGPSVAELVRKVLLDECQELPAHIHLVPADAQVNTYDIVQVADLGLAYTTTVGMEMAMSGVPVIAVGKTHYRGKGFTLDVDTWEAYFELLASAVVAPERYRPSQEQVERAWSYAYRFFFEYPQPFPWHLLNFWKDQETWSPGRVLSDAGQEAFGKTFACLAGEPVQW
jgi:hypothetical protein